MQVFELFILYFKGDNHNRKFSFKEGISQLELSFTTLCNFISLWTYYVNLGGAGMKTSDAYVYIMCLGFCVTPAY